MFVAMFRAQWVWVRSHLAVLAFAALVIPLLSLQPGATIGVENTIGRGEALSYVMVVIALVAGVALATLTWSADARGRHIYALALPIGRGRYVWYRALGTLLLLGLPALCCGLGTMLAASRLQLPPVLHSYPWLFALRVYAVMCLAACISYAFTFGLSPRSRRIGLVTLLLLVAISTLGQGTRETVTRRMWRGAFSSPSPLAIVAGPWKVFDV